MAGDATVETIEIVRALHAAGLLERASMATTSTPESAPVPAAPPPVDHNVGEEVMVFGVTSLDKRINTKWKPDQLVRLTNHPTPGTTVTYYLEFPPNDAAWLPEIDKIIAAPKPLAVQAWVDVVEVISSSQYGAKLTALQVGSSLP